MATNQERDDLITPLQAILNLKKDPNQATMTLSTTAKNAVKSVVKEVDAVLERVLGPGNKMQQTQQNQQNPNNTGPNFSATFPANVGAQILSQLNNNPLLQQFGQAFLNQNAGQQQQSSLPNPLNTGIPKNVPK